MYTYNVYNSLGEHIVATGHLDGNIWTWKAEQKLNGVVTQARYTFNFVSKNSYTFKSEVQTSPSGAWVTVMQGTATGRSSFFPQGHEALRVSHSNLDSLCSVSLG